MTIYTDNLKRPIVGNAYVPDSMEARGKIRPIAPINGTRNGQGLQVRAGLWAYDWSFTSLTRADYQWWADLIGFMPVITSPTPIFSKRFVEIGSGGTYMPACRLWVNNTTIVNFKACVVDLPTWQDYKGGLYREVTVHLAFMIPVGD